MSNEMTTSASELLLRLTRLDSNADSQEVRIYRIIQKCFSFPGVQIAHVIL